MTNKDYYQGVRKMLDTILRQAGKLCIDIELLNNIGIETNKRLKSVEDK